LLAADDTACNISAAVGSWLAAACLGLSFCPFATVTEQEAMYRVAALRQWKSKEKMRRGKEIDMKLKWICKPVP
jgi:hypothetical protein